MSTKSNLTGEAINIYTGLDAATSALLSNNLSYNSGTDITVRNATVAGSASIAGTLNVTGAVTTPAINASIATTPTVNATTVGTTTLNASGTCTMPTLVVSGTGTIGTLTTSGAALGGTTTMNAVTVSGSLSSGAHTITGALNVNGAYTQTGASTNTFTGTVVAPVANITTLTSHAVTCDLLTSTGTLVANTSMAAPTATITTINTNTVNGVVLNATNVNSTSSSTLDTLAVTYNETVGGTLAVTGTTTCANVNSNATINATNVTATNGTITNLAAGTINATNLSYSGTGTFPSVTVSGNTSTGTLTVSGSSAIPSVSGTTTFGNALFVHTNNESSASNGGIWLDSTNATTSTWDSNLISDTVLNTVELNGRHDGGYRYINLRDNANVQGSLVVGTSKSNGATRAMDGSITSTGNMSVGGTLASTGMASFNGGACVDRTTKFSLYGPSDPNNVLYYDASPDGVALVGWQGGYLGGLSSGSLQKALTWDASGHVASLTTSGVFSGTSAGFVAAGYSSGVYCQLQAYSFGSVSMSGSTLSGFAQPWFNTGAWNTWGTFPSGSITRNGSSSSGQLFYQYNSGAIRLTYFLNVVSVSNATGQRAMGITMNNNNVGVDISDATGGGCDTCHCISGEVVMNSGDLVQCVYAQNSGSNVTASGAAYFVIQ